MVKFGAILEYHTNVHMHDSTFGTKLDHTLLAAHFDHIHSV